jgi:NTP pyrophosphatase (non-canonical NTP hydrolase)
MTLEELQAFIDEQDEILRRVKTMNQTDRDRIYARTIKLGEEYGELCDAVLGSFGDQRQDKLDDSDRENLKGEFADVVIVAYLLAKAMDIDMTDALKQKMEKIRSKHNKILNGEHTKK